MSTWTPPEGTTGNGHLAVLRANPYTSNIRILFESNCTDHSGCSSRSTNIPMGVTTDTGPYSLGINKRHPMGGANEAGPQGNGVHHMRSTTETGLQGLAESILLDCH